MSRLGEPGVDHEAEALATESLSVGSSGQGFEEGFDDSGQRIRVEREHEDHLVRVQESLPLGRPPGQPHEVEDLRCRSAPRGQTGG